MIIKRLQLSFDPHDLITLRSRVFEMTLQLPFDKGYGHQIWKIWTIRDSIKLTFKLTYLRFISGFIALRSHDFEKSVNFLSKGIVFTKFGP